MKNVGGNIIEAFRELDDICLSSMDTVKQIQDDRLIFNISQREALSEYSKKLASLSGEIDKFKNFAFDYWKHFGEEMVLESSSKIEVLRGELEELQTKILKFQNDAKEYLRGFKFKYTDGSDQYIEVGDLVHISYPRYEDNYGYLDLEYDQNMGEVIENSEGRLRVAVWEFPGIEQNYSISRKEFGYDEKLFKYLGIVRLNNALEDTGYKVVKVEE